MWYTITKVEEKKHWSNKFGGFITYDIGLLGDDGVPCPSCALNQKDSTPAPVVDGRLHGWIEDTDFGQKFNKTQPEDGGSSSQAPARSGASQASTGQGNGDTQVSIERQSMVKAAAEFLAGQTKDATEVIKAASVFLAFVQTGDAGLGSKSEPVSEIDKHLAAETTLADAAEKTFFDEERP